MNPDLTASIEHQTAHRPWPLPAGPWRNYQSWQRLLFMHWPVSGALLRPLVPPALEIEHFRGSAWLGIVPFELCDFKFRLPGKPGLGNFPELNVRTYVAAKAISGVYFFSLDAASLLAVVGARATFGLPYFHAKMSAVREGEWTAYSSERTMSDAVFRGRYRPTGPPMSFSPDSLEAFLVERYALLAATPSGAVRCGEIHHRKWELRPAEAIIEINSMAEASGIALPDAPPVLHYVDRQDTLIWMPRSLQ